MQVKLQTLFQRMVVQPEIREAFKSLMRVDLLSNLPYGVKMPQVKTLKKVKYWLSEELKLVIMQERL